MLPTQQRWQHAGLFSLGVVTYLFLIGGRDLTLFGADDGYGLALNYFYLTLINGNFDIPPRVIGAEGHYLKDGTAVVYFGLLPAVLRGLFAPLVDLSTQSIGRCVVFLTCSLGACLCHVLVLRRSKGGVCLLLSAAVWFASPFLFLSASAIVFHEPIALSLLLICGFLFVLTSRAWTSWRFLALWVLAGLACLTRLHTGAILLASAWFISLIWTLHGPLGRRKMITIALGGFVGVAAVLILMWSNEARFGGPLIAHGAADGTVRYGFVFFQEESYDTPRHVATGRQGVFNPLRILANAPFLVFGGWNAHTHITRALGLTFILKRAPASQALLSYWPWLVLAVCGLFARWRVSGLSLRPQHFLAWRKAIALGLAAGLALIILSYYAAARRYTAEIWPVFLIAALLAAPYVSQWFDRLGKLGITLLTVAMVLTAAINIYKAALYSDFWEARKPFEGGIMAADTCAEIFAVLKAKKNPPREDFCRDPRDEHRTSRVKAEGLSRH